VVFGVAGLLLGALVGLIYDPSRAWLTSLIGAAEAGLLGAAIGGFAGYAHDHMRSAFCRHEISGR
jgi:hypothetical protein